MTDEIAAQVSADKFFAAYDPGEFSPDELYKRGFYAALSSRGDAGTPGWVSVKDRLPNANGEFLIVETADKEASTADFRKDTAQWWTVRSFGQDCEERELYSVTHWMELPSVPEAEAALAHREGEQDAGTRMYEPHTRVLELYYAQKDGCKTHPIGCGKICLECVADELTERESAWRKEREALQHALERAFVLIEGLRLGTTWEIAPAIKTEMARWVNAYPLSAAPQPIPEGGKK